MRSTRTEGHIRILILKVWSFREAIEGRSSQNKGDIKYSQDKTNSKKIKIKEIKKEKN